MELLIDLKKKIEEQHSSYIYALLSFRSMYKIKNFVKNNDLEDFSVIKIPNCVLALEHKDGCWVEFHEIATLIEDEFKLLA